MCQFSYVLIHVFYSLIMVLKNEEQMVQDRVRVYELDNTRGISIRKRKNKYVENDIAIKTAVTEFNQILAPTHLRTIQFRLASSKFDNWDD
jgi:hypothetical protein